MTRPIPGPGPTHRALGLLAPECRDGAMSRREFLSRATALGVGIAAAYAALGQVAPARAASHAAPRAGGTLRCAMTTRPLKDPRLYDWPEMANFSRGWLEYLVQYDPDGSFRGMLLERWEANDNATEYRLHVRPGVRWNTGEPFAAADVARNIERWCDGTVALNSMASRMATLVDPETRRARAGAISVEDPLTVRLTLPKPDITLIPGMADYPAAIVHRGYDGGDPARDPVGTGPYLPVENAPGSRQILERNADHAWWGSAVHGGPFLERIEYLDLGTDPASVLAAAEAGGIDMTHETPGKFLAPFDTLGWQRSAAVTAATIVIRGKHDRPPYSDPRVRRAIAMAVDNAVVLELGYADLGLVAENHHVCPIHPEYAALPPPVPDPAAARALMVQAGALDRELDLISIDDEWQALTCDAVAAQLLDAGFRVRRTLLPGQTFRDGWREHTFSATEWNMRPLGVQILALAYRSGEAWNETGYASAEFDALMTRALSIDKADERRAVMARLQGLMQRDGVILQPYWRSLFRHARPGVAGADMHPTFEHHHYEWWLET